MRPFASCGRRSRSSPATPRFSTAWAGRTSARGNAAEAEKYLAPAAEQLPKNSVIQDHLGDVHAERGRWPDAIAAWQRALEGDGEDIDRAVIEKKISDARARIR